MPVRKERLGAKDKIIVPTCPRRLSLAELPGPSSSCPVYGISRDYHIFVGDLVAINLISLSRLRAALRATGVRGRSDGEDARGHGGEKRETEEKERTAYYRKASSLNTVGTPLMPKTPSYKRRYIRWDIISGCHNHNDKNQRDRQRRTERIALVISYYAYYKLSHYRHKYS